MAYIDPAAENAKAPASVSMADDDPTALSAKARASASMAYDDPAVKNAKALVSASMAKSDIPAPHAKAPASVSTESNVTGVKTAIQTAISHTKSEASCITPFSDKARSRTNTPSKSSGSIHGGNFGRIGRPKSNAGTKTTLMT